MQAKNLCRRSLNKCIYKKQKQYVVNTTMYKKIPTQ